MAKRCIFVNWLETQFPGFLIVENFCESYSLIIIAVCQAQNAQSDLNNLKQEVKFEFKFNIFLMIFKSSRNKNLRKFEYIPKYFVFLTSRRVVCGGFYFSPVRYFSGAFKDNAYATRISVINATLQIFIPQKLLSSYPGINRKPPDSLNAYLQNRTYCDFDL